MPLNQEDIRQFRERRERLGKMLSESSEKVQELNMSAAVGTLKQLSNKVENDTFKLQVIGTFKNGKSTFINSLLGEPVLPAYALPCTAVINEVKYGVEKKAILYFRQDLPQTLHSSISQKALAHMNAHGMKNVPPLEIDYREIEDYVTIPMGEDPIELLLESPYEKVELYWPLDILKEGVEIIDSPGLNEAETRTKVTMDYLTKADAILFVLNAQALCSLDEMNFIEHLNELGFTDLFFIVNRFDCIPNAEKDRIKQYARLRLDNFTSNGIFFISAQQALDGEMQNDNDLYTMSGMPILSSALSSFLTKDKGRIKLTQPARELKRINSEALFNVIPSQLNMLSSSYEIIQQRYDDAQPQLEALKTRRQQIIAGINLRIEQSKHELSRASNQHVLSVCQMIPGWVNDYTPIASLGLIPTKTKVKVVTKEILDHINNKIIEQQREWQSEVMMPLVEEKLHYIFNEGVESDLEKLFNDLDNLSIEISGIQPINPQQVPVWQRIVGAGAGIFLGMPDLAVAGGLNGLTKELAKNLAIVLGTEAVLALFLGLANPLVLIGGVIAAIMGGGFTKDKAMTKLKTQVSEQFVDKISDGSEESTSQVVSTIASHLNKLTEGIETAISAEIKQKEDEVKGILHELQQGQANAEARKIVIQECGDKLKTINEKLVQLIFELAEQH